MGCEMDVTQAPRKWFSYGILRTEPFGDYQEHAKKKCTWNPHDGKAYIQNTIYWFLKKGHHDPPVWGHEIETTHLLDVLPGPLICEEELFVSDSATGSHYRKGNRKNKGAERVGAIQVYVSFLRGEGLITPEEAPTNKAGKEVGARNYKITQKMRIKVIGRDLECAFL